MRKEIDAKGIPCPRPVLLAKKEIDSGECNFLIHVDNRTAVENLKRLADTNGFSIQTVEDHGAFSIVFERQGELLKTSNDGREQRLEKPVEDWVVFVPRAVLGDGDTELGLSLIRMYFYTISQTEHIPKAILFMNAGVKLPVQDEQIIEHLQLLLSKGAEILVCGACLNFYGLTEQLQVGTISNMYDITQRMEDVAKVITL